MMGRHLVQDATAKNTHSFAVVALKCHRTKGRNRAESASGAFLASIEKTPGSGRQSRLRLSALEPKRAGTGAE